MSYCADSETRTLRRAIYFSCDSALSINARGLCEYDTGVKLVGVLVVGLLLVMWGLLANLAIAVRNERKAKVL